MKKRYAIALLLLMVACGTPLEQPMRDFNAYFNSFYNAQKVFEEGLEQNLNQSLPINPELPIPVYPAPSRGGAQSFEDAIMKGAQILRDHKDTRFEYAAIEMIGKSYYYRQEYFSALEKFSELQNVSEGEMRQNALYWKGRVYFHMNAIEEGIEFLESEMDLISDWEPAIRAKTSVVLAQLYVANDQWREAFDQLQVNVPLMENRKDRDRAYFLMGQVAEQLGDFNMAKDAYSNVRTSNPDYDLVFHAMRKEASVARSLGEYDRAYNLFRSLSRDDKFIQERPDLVYDLGRTLQLMGSTEEAARQYGALLRDDRLRPSPETKAKTYYGIAEIYRYDLGDYVFAAAYYDSASMQRVDLDKLPAGFDAQEMAESFGEYASIQLEVAELDSLLWLGQLEPSAFDSVLSVIQKRLEEEQRREQELLEQQQSQSTAVIVNPDQIQDVATSSEFGFLNAQNQRLQQDASLQFRAVWGERPLADLWRRRAEITDAGNRLAGSVDTASGNAANGAAGSGNVASGEAADEEPVNADVSGVETDDSSSDDSEITGGELAQNTESGMPKPVEGPGRQNASTRPHAPLVDISRVPFTQQEQDSVRKMIDELHYRLANVYFLSLEEPDNARTYYEDVIDRDLHKTLIPKALYSLTELHLLEDQTEEAQARGMQLLETYPESVFAERIANRLGVEFDPPEQERERSAQVQIEELEAFMEDTVLSAEHRAELYRSLADSLEGDAVKPYLYLEAAMLYIEEAKQSAPDSLPDRSGWFLAQEQWELQKQELAEVKDSVRIVLADSVIGNTYRLQFFRDRFEEREEFWEIFPDSLSPETKLGDREMQFFQQLSDSSLTEPVWFELFPFQGALWDSARVTLDEYLASAGSSPQKPRITKLAASLVVPEDPNAIPVVLEEMMPDSARTDSLGIPIEDGRLVPEAGIDSMGVDSMGVDSIGVDSLSVDGSSSGIPATMASDSTSSASQDSLRPSEIVPSQDSLKIAPPTPTVPSSEVPGDSAGVNLPNSGEPAEPDSVSEEVEDILETDDGGSHQPETN